MNDKRQTPARAKENPPACKTKWLVRLMVSAIICTTAAFAVHRAAQIILVAQIIG